MESEYAENDYSTEVTDTVFALLEHGSLVSKLELRKEIFSMDLVIYYLPYGISFKGFNNIFCKLNAQCIIVDW